jgi:type II secretory pathway component PulM
MWDRLPKRQQYMVAAGFAAVVVGLLLQFAVLPLFDEKKRMEASLAASEKTLRVLDSLGREYLTWKQGADAVREIAARRSPDFSLFTYLEGKAGEAGIKDSVTSLTPLKVARTGGLEEQVVEIKLEKLTLHQLVRFLYLVEAPDDLITVRKASLVKMKEQPEYLASVLHVVTYRVAQEARPQSP